MCDLRNPAGNTEEDWVKMAYLALSPNAKYAISTWYYQWGRADFKMGIVSNANFEFCATSLVILGILTEWKWHIWNVSYNAIYAQIAQLALWKMPIVLSGIMVYNCLLLGLIWFTLTFLQSGIVLYNASFATFLVLLLKISWW